ncbi:MAG TPA: hypothetical protein VFQ77_18170 [Pseudonocardiaceae bacterium]|nr:hypothetical protein [Pseudonocardiaceae bacterium]
MRRLLANWPGIEGVGGPDRLFDMLRKNPPLMRLARSPLLLTMIAYLHVEVFAKTGRTLPSSLVEFYDTAIAHLLGRDIDLGRGKSLTTYDVSEKLAALQRVALALQETPTSEPADRLAMSRSDLLRVIGQTLPELKRDDTHAKPLLDEIVDRSQLLVPLDRSNWHYQFRHLTMQEYLAARELAGDPDRLMAHYRADPDAWRETVKLWCADGRDCTAVVAEVFAAAEPRHRVLALECLADAKRIDVELADKVINHFLARLGKRGDDSEAIIRAFGAVAADSRPRGDKVLGLLTDLTHLLRSSRRASAFRALAASGRVEAARVLAPQAPGDPDARAALRAMGELAIPVLADHAGDGKVWAVDDLAVIGTPAAAESLAKVLWATEQVATRAAWRLAELLRNPDVEDGLSRTDNTADPATPSYDWIWRPFAPSTSTTMRAIMGRVAYLLDKGPADLIPRDAECIDTRIGLPIAALGINAALRVHAPRVPEWYQRYAEPTTNLAREFVDEQKIKVLSEMWYSHVRDAFDQASRGDAPSSLATQLSGKLLDRQWVDPRYRRMVELLTWPVRAQVLGRLIATYSPVTQKHWVEVTETPRSSNALWAVTRLVTVAALLGTCGITTYQSVTTITGSSPLGPEWLAWLWLSSLVLLVMMILLVVLCSKILDYDNPLTAIAAVGSMIYFFLSLIFILIFGIITVVQWIGWAAIPFGTLIAVLIGVPAAVAIHREELVNANALRPCLNADRQVQLGRRSVIAG